MSMETITLGGGCFWCVEAVYNDLKGVDRAVSGYSGGTLPRPTYQQVCAGQTGHAEVVQLTFDPAVISLKDILEVFFTVHDPTTLNRQGNDLGPQYRSIILYRDAEQKRVAEDVIRDVAAKGIWDGKIVTELKPFEEFYPAEDYHQEYFRQNPDQPYCQAVVGPKVAKFRKQYFDRLKR